MENCEILEIYTKPYHFCFKKVVETCKFAILGAIGPKNAKFYEFYEVSWISWKFHGILIILGCFSHFPENGDSGQNDPKYH